MKFELKNVKHSEFASQETHCYEATLYVDGKRFCIVGNDGHGGCDYHHGINGMTNSELYERINKFDKELAKEIISCGERADGSHYEVSNCLEIICGELVNDFLSKREIKGWLRKVCTIDDDGKVSSYNITNKKFQDHKEQYLAMFEKKNPNAVILNDMVFDEAFALINSFE